MRVVGDKTGRSVVCWRARRVVFRHHHHHHHQLARYGKSTAEWCVCQFMSGHNRCRHTVTHHSDPTSITMAPSSPSPPSPRREIILGVTVGGPTDRPAGTCSVSSRHRQPGDQWLDAATFHTIPQFTFIHSLTLATAPYTSSTAIPNAFNVSRNYSFDPLTAVSCFRHLLRETEDNQVY